MHEYLEQETGICYFGELYVSHFLFLVVSTRLFWYATSVTETRGGGHKRCSHLFQCTDTLQPTIDGLAQERRNSIANALESRLSCTNPSIFRSCGNIYSLYTNPQLEGSVSVRWSSNPRRSALGGECWLLQSSLCVAIANNGAGERQCLSCTCLANGAELTKLEYSTPEMLSHTWKVSVVSSARLSNLI